MKLSEHSNCILDIGANTGLFSVLSSLSNKQANIYSFEPHSSNSNRMRKNLSLNNIQNVTIMEQAVGNEVGELLLSVPSDNSITDVSSANHEFSKAIYSDISWDVRKVPLNTVDNFSNSLSFPIDLIKCDVETFEIEVFNGMKKVLKQDKQTIIFEYFLDETKKEYFNQLLKDYYAYLILTQGLVHTEEGLVYSNEGLNYLITPVKPSKSFLSYSDERLHSELLFRKN